MQMPLIRIVRIAIVLPVAICLAMGAGPILPLKAGPSLDTPSSVLLLGTGTSGLYRSTNGGQTWQRAGAGLPAGGVWQVQADPSHPGVAYGTTGSVFRTADAGLHWQPVAGLHGSGAGYSALATQGSALLAAGPAGIMVSGTRRWVE